MNPNLFIPLNYLQQYFVDKQTGLPLSRGVVYFFHDTDRNNAKPVYQISGSPPNYTYTALSNPVELTNVGTFSSDGENDITVYCYPYDAAGNPDNYYIQVFATPSVPPFPPVGTPEFTRENVPGVTASEGPGETGPLSFNNVLANSQFVDVLFDPAVGLPIAYTVGTTTAQIAPGWALKIVSTGSGTVTVTRTSIAGNLNRATNPPYSLTISPSGSGISSLILYQRLQNNPNIFAGSYLNVGLALAPSSQPVTVYYAPQGTIALPALGTFSNGGGQWAYFNASTTEPLPNGTNTANADTGYVDIEYSLTPGAVTTLSSMQLVFLADNTEQAEPITNIPYNQVPVIDQKSGNSFFYDPLFAYKPIPSYLVGWDFPLNPAQFGEAKGPFPDGANTGEYVWDQTIVFQTATNGYTAARATNGGLLLTGNATGQIALIQYLDQVEARKILSDRASVHMSLFGNVAGGATGHVTLWATTNANLPTLTTTLITALAADGTVATPAAGWTVVPNLYNNTKFTVPLVSATNSESIDINLNGWDLQGAAPANTAKFFAIVVGFTAWTNGDTLNINSISLCAGDIATRPAPKTLDETLSDCERYYEMSYSSQRGHVAATVTTFNQLCAPMMSSFIITPPGTQCAFLENSFGFQFRTQKRIPTTQGYPTVTMYSPFDGTSGAVYANYNGQADNAANDLITRWAAPVIGDKTVYFASTAATFVFPAVNFRNDQFPLICWINYHFVADARLGVVN